MSQTHVKDPEATRTYTIDWTDYLTALGGSVTVDESEWTVPAGLSVVSEASTSSSTSIKLSGGTLNQDYTVYNKITTSGGDIDRRAILVQIRDASTFAEPTENEITLTAIRALLADKATADQKEYTIANRQLKRYDMTELLALEKRYTQLVNAEKRAAAARQGKPVLQNIYTRFTKPR